VPGVRAVTHWTFFAGYYREPRNGMTLFAADIPALLEVFPQIRLPPEQRQAAARTRTGMIVSSALAARYGWKVGDRVPVTSSIWQRKDGGRAYDADIVGIMDLSRLAAFPDAFLQYDYFDEARARGGGTVHWYIVRLADPHDAMRVAAAIDAMFANSASETSTVNEKQWAQNQLKQVGDVQLITRSIVGAVLFALLFLTGNTMMQSVSERLPELAVLKTVGYSDGGLFALIAAESLVLCLFACLAGLALADVIFRPLAPVFGEVSLPLPVVASGAGIAVFLALASGLPPAWRAARLRVVDALANR
jgi:putative ABC transport system permease protein